jgi:hypothetical protein
MQNRRDSGVDADPDSGMDSPQEDAEGKAADEQMQVDMGSPKRVQRVISSDSAFGDELEMA